MCLQNAVGLQTFQQQQQQTVSVVQQISPPVQYPVQKTASNNLAEQLLKLQAQGKAIQQRQIKNIIRTTQKTLKVSTICCKGLSLYRLPSLCMVMMQI